MRRPALPPPAPPILLTLTGSLIAWAAAEGGAALYFDGRDDYAVILPGFRLLDAWTVEAWVQPSEPVEAAGCILGFQSFSLRNLLTVSATSQRGLSVTFGPDEQAIPNNAWSVAPAGLFSTGRHHLSLTHQALSSLQSRLQLYLNGTLRAEWVVDASAARARQEPVLPLILGACHSPGRGEREGSARGIQRSRFFRGFVDEVRWWSLALPAAQIHASMGWTGQLAEWPATEWVGGELGPAAEAARAAALQTQYSMDVLTQSLFDGTGHNKHGYRGTAVASWAGNSQDAPKYVATPFSKQLDYGASFRALRENQAKIVDFLVDLYTVAGPTHNGLLILDLPENVTLLDPANGATLAVGSVVAGLKVRAVTTSQVPYATFSFKPCVGVDNLAPVLSACTGTRRRPVSLTVLPSSPPTAGVSFALRLLRRGGFVRLPKPRLSWTVEFWAKFVSPLSEGSTLLNIREFAGVDGTPGREALRVMIDPAGGGAWLEMCVAGQELPARHLIPGMATMEAQHISMSFKFIEVGATSSYDIRVHRDGILALAASVEDPCFRFDSTRLRLPTLGQRYVEDLVTASGGKEPWSESFLPMYVDDIRVWARALSAPTGADLTGLTSGDPPLVGDEPGLVAYARITSADNATAAAAVGEAARSLALVTVGGSSQARRLSEGSDSIEALCADDASLCPELSGGAGFALWQSPFSFPPEAAHLATGGSTELRINLTAFDPDDYAEDAVTLETSTSEVRYFELTAYPDAVCGTIFGEGDELQIRTVGRTSKEVIYPGRVPLRFVPFGGATVIEEEAMNGTCITELRYRAVDTQGLASPKVAAVDMRVWGPGVSLTSVRASARGTALPTADFEEPPLGTSPLVLANGGVLRFDFSGPTSQPAGLGAAGLFEVINGSWGNSDPGLVWANNGATLIVELDGMAVAQGALIAPGTTRFRVREEADLRVAGDPLSKPCSDLSPLLAGDFVTPDCMPGAVLNKTAARCELCPPGTYWTADADRTAPECLPCAGGRFASSAGSLECLACEPGRYMPVNSSNRSECIAGDLGEFVPGAEETFPMACMAGALADAPEQIECRACPAGATCSAPGQVSSKAWALPEFFALPSGDFDRCRVPASCLGAEVCAPGARADGIHLACYPCAVGYSRGAGALRDRSKCEQCPETLRGALLICLGVLLASLFLVFLMARLNVTAACHLGCLHAFILKVGMGHLFLMQTLLAIEEWELRAAFENAAPTLYYAMVAVLSWDGHAPLWFVPMQCLLEWTSFDLEGRLWLEFGIWAAIPTALALLCLLLSYIFVQGVALAMPDNDDPKEGVDGANPDALSSVVPIWLPPEGGQQQQQPKPDADDTDGDAFGHTGESFWAGNGLDMPPALLSKVPQWKVAWSDEYHRNYYYNEGTGISQWTRPIGEEIEMHTTQSWMSMDDRGIGGIDLISEQLQPRVGGIWRWPSTSKGWRWRFLEDSTGLVLAALIVTYPGVLRQMMAFLRCDRLGNLEESRLLMAPDIVCGSPPHTALAWAAVAFLAVWGLGGPALTYYLYATRGNKLGDFNMLVRWGVLFADYEHQRHHMEVARLLQTFAAVAAATLAPSAPRELRLVLLLALGNVAAFMHQTIEPLTNLSGYLLDSAVTQSLWVFCATTTALLLGFSRVVNPSLVAAVLMAALIAHVLFVLRLIQHFVENLRRSVADSVVSLHMCGQEASSWRLKVFAWEMKARGRQAHVSYNMESNEIVVAAPVTNTRVVSDEEQRYVASALGDCLAHVVAGSKVDRLSCHFLEYLGRTSFAMSAEKLDREMQARQRVRPSMREPSAKPSVRAQSERSTGSHRAGGVPSTPRRRRVSRSGFDANTFRQGMLAGDFGGALNAVCLACETERMEHEFHSFMMMKNVEFGDYHLSPLKRMLKNFEHGKMRPPWADEKNKGATCTTLMVRPLQKMLPPPIVYDITDDDNAEDAKPEDVAKNSVLKRGEPAGAGKVGRRTSAGVRTAEARRSRLFAQAEHEHEGSPSADSPEHIVDLPNVPNRRPFAADAAGAEGTAAQASKPVAPGERGVEGDVAGAGVGVVRSEDTGAGVGAIGGDDTGVGGKIAEDAAAKRRAAPAPTAPGATRRAPDEAVGASIRRGLTTADVASTLSPRRVEVIGCNGVATLVPWGVLGLQRGQRVAPEPHGGKIVVVDATTAEGIARGPGSAAGETAELCRWLGIASAQAYPDEVRGAVDDELDARLHRYGDGHEVIHVAAPNLGDLKYQGDHHQVIEALTIAYRRIFEQFCDGAGPAARRLRIPALSLNELAGDHEHDVPEFTAEAFRDAMKQLSGAARERINHLDALELCVCDEELFPVFVAAFESKGLGKAYIALS